MDDLYCPECGNENIREPEEKGHYQCEDRDCLQEFFTDVKYSQKDVLKSKARKIKELEALRATAREQYSILDHKLAEAEKDRDVVYKSNVVLNDNNNELREKLRREMVKDFKSENKLREAVEIIDNLEAAHELATLERDALYEINEGLRLEISKLKARSLKDLIIKKECRAI